MPRSSTSYRPKWKLGETTVLRVPQKLASAVLRYAHELDKQSDDTAQILRQLPGELARTPGTTKPLKTSQKAPMPEVKETIRASVATGFHHWRLKNKVPLKKVAADLGVCVATVNKWERGERFPSGCHLGLLAQYTGLPPCRLFCILADKCVPADCLPAMVRRP
jgi:DNA-binding transcriptional regulator YiaG